MKRKLLILLLGVAVLGSAAFAADPASPFLPFYFVKGTMTGVNPIANTIVIFKTTPQMSISSPQSGASPLPYLVNLFDAQYFGKFGVDAGGIYSIGVANGANNFGTDPISFEVSGMGYETVDLLLELGKGKGLLPPDGTVALGIEKDGGGIKLTWDNVANPNVDIYKMTGDGTGKFNQGPSADWVIATANQGGGSWSDSGVFAAGAKEIYYKALVAGKPNTLLTGAWAVGKFDYNLIADYNLLSLPLSSLAGTSIDKVFFSQLTINDAEFFSRDDSTGGYSKDQVISNNWQNISGSPASLSVDKAYWVRMPTAKTVSLLGAVGTVTHSRIMTGTHNESTGYNLFGWPFPNNNTMVAGGLPAHNNNEVFKRFESTDPPSYQKLYDNGGTWANADPNKAVFGFSPGAGYWYRNTIASDEGWTAPAP